MLVYDITNEKTFENIVKWLRNIDEVSASSSVYNQSSGNITSPNYVACNNYNYSMRMRMWKR